jgi:hypothetical protein
MMTITDFFNKIRSKIAAVFASKGGQIVKDAVGAVLKELTAAALSMLLDVAKNKAVQVEALGTLRGDMKFNAVKQAVSDAAHREGLLLANRTLDTIVQLAAQAVK